MIRHGHRNDFLLTYKLFGVLQMFCLLNLTLVLVKVQHCAQY